MAEEDDGFQDFLSEDEEECALQEQEAAAMERRMRSLGIRDGLEFGKEDTLQEGFDAGFAAAVTRSHRFGTLRGALSAALVCGIFDGASDAEATKVKAKALAATLRLLAMQTAATPGSEAAAEQLVEAAPTPEGGTINEAGEEEEAAVEAARALLASIHVEVPDL